MFLNPLSANPTKWSNTLKQFVPTNCLNVFDHSVKLALKGLIIILAVFTGIWAKTVWHRQKIAWSWNFANISPIPSRVTKKKTYPIGHRNTHFRVNPRPRTNMTQNWYLQILTYYIWLERQFYADQLFLSLNGLKMNHSQFFRESRCLVKIKAVLLQTWKKAIFKLMAGSGRFPNCL